jgi:predicted DNA-binding protein (UPF0278 family)
MVAKLDSSRHYDVAIDCAMNADALVVTSNLKDFRSARESLGLWVMTPVELVSMLATGEFES